MDQNSLERSTLRKVAWRLMPFICLCYVLNILDRANVGFARLNMQTDLKLDEDMFNLGYGMFYLGYLLFEVPSNLLMRKVGARRWIARIMITWGIVSALTMFAWDEWSFYGLRVLLGIAEAGFFPGIILYLSYWFPDQERGKMTAFFMLAIGLASVFGNPISGFIMQYLDTAAGLHGWQWLFLLEGIPSMLVGFAVLFYLTDSPKHANWLASEERDWLIARMQHEEETRRAKHNADHLAAMMQWRVWLLIAIYFTVAVGTNAAGAHLPKLIKADFEGMTTFQIGLLSALPHLCAVLGMTVFGISSDRNKERRLHLAAAAGLGAAGWALTAATESPVLRLVGLCLAQTGMMSMLPIFWTLPTAFLTGAAAAGGIALINSVANIGGFFGATILGRFGLWSMALCLFAGALLAMGTGSSTKAKVEAT
ncbi:MAG: MFS transporter [Planctomycetaceae bacterium]|nr:MFS transporter [Planctomycetaceae bacterium]MCB9951734.1 MFS transporter [Planctomycetaceae bacterium]